MKIASIEPSEQDDGILTWTNVSYLIRGDSGDVISGITDQSMEIIKNSSPWYWFLVKRTWTIQIIVSVVGIFLLEFANNLVYVSPLGQTSLGWSDSTTTVYATAWLILLVIWTVVIGGLTASKWKKIFPIGKIVIGLERRRENTRDWIRRLVITLTLTVVIALASNWIAI